MHYEDLYITHRGFWRIERRARHYDVYMKQVKDWRKWPESVDLLEIQKLLNFIPKWDMHFRMKDPVKVYAVYQKILPVITETRSLKLENVNLDADLMKKIACTFDELAPCSEKAYESTDCSKILHTILPNLIVMWDRKIRQGVLGDENKNRGSIYALEFLPLMQTELREAVATCMDDRRLAFGDAAEHIRDTCGRESLPKLIDEHNYVLNTMKNSFAKELERMKMNNEITSEEYKRLLRKL